MDQSRHIILNLNMIPGGVYASAWRTGYRPAHSFASIEHFKELAEIAERGKLDALFLADGGYWSLKAEYQAYRHLDPVIVLTYLAALTSKIGLIVTASSSYNTPYNLARRILSLDHVSGGRAGWNIVVTAGDDAARNFSLDSALPKEERYKRATEFLEIVTALWRSWAPDALLADADSGRFVDGSKVHPINYNGEHFRVDGPMVTLPSTQGAPVIVQAGGSEAGTDLAARFCHVVYSTQPSYDGARAFRTELKKRAQDQGRNPDAIKLVPGLMTIVGANEKEARDRSDYLLSLIPQQVAIAELSARSLVPEQLLLDHLDKELPWDIIPESLLSGAGHGGSILRQAHEERLTVRQLAKRNSSVEMHATAVGSAEQVADKIQHWFETGAVDGFNIMPAELPKGASEFVDHVVPILQDRGIFRRDYEKKTLRGHYGLQTED
ncbi:MULTISPECIES: NtaA/DmoA family FMN-dependent monooxygenase [Rhizobium/Agrobacterium group]|uniref:Nitrilotriacetate monooxygenase component A (NTA monooxygenase component A) (NTA-MO A) n=1 Tax=Agrobacterium tumefaciens str. Kerr 14 TaxID=1183424 RepID=A0A1S7SD30_AGRTU|nr:MULTISPECIES: NtaA/DmoA family FMN-dependent monooxygenase [Rhizobium/Agrobacterium group]NTF97808.1 NtaA/DmoA family FMN-dependent monooxygenase [Rhizobium rhizogenes]CUX67014.1 nitrilotriacetate monooxygenase component A (NTA monooxygenase component A) (NTA-MO A) [Agrobacterium tumefaciens str. Kerr 14]